LKSTTPSPNPSPDSISRGILTAAGVVVIIAGMRAADTIMAPFLVALFISVILASPVAWLQQKGVPSIVAVLLCVGGILAVGFGVGALVGTSLDTFTRNLPSYEVRLQDKTDHVLAFFQSFGLDVPESGITGYISPGALMTFIADLLRGLGGVLANAFLILLIVVFILLESSSFPNRVRKAFGRPETSFKQFSGFTDKLKRYLAIKTWVSLATGIITTLWLVILGVDFPLLWGLLAFLLNYIPNLGSIIAAVPPILLSIIQLGWGTSALVALGYLVVNNVVGNFVEPRFMGKGLGLSTLVVFLSLLFWGWVLGPVGMFLSVPLTMTLAIALAAGENTRWMAVMLGSEAEV